MRRIFIAMLLMATGFVSAQELNCTVTVSADKLAVTNKQVFKTLEQSLTEFLNKSDWTGQGFLPSERINCSMFINITAVAGNSYQGTIQVQSSRPVFNSTYSSPVFNFNDKDFSFDYTEFQRLSFNPVAYESNLISVVTFYAFMIIAFDADTFAPNGGAPYFDTALAIANTAQSGQQKGWLQGESGNQNRYFLINDIISPTYSAFHDALFQYHFQGMDVMYRDPKNAKEQIKAALADLKQLHSIRPNAFLTRVFFDAKSDEIVSIFSGGPSIPIDDLTENLNRISPLNAVKWANIKF